MSDPTPIVGPDLSTVGAAKRATELGRPTSRSYLEKARARGPDDRRDTGPDFYRDANNRCWYEPAAIERWVGAWRLSRAFRAPGAIPPGFSQTRQAA